MEKKRYILFGYSTYYPSGGMDDALISFDTEEELKIESNHFTSDYFDILDSETFVSGTGYSPLEAWNSLKNKSTQ